MEFQPPANGSVPASNGSHTGGWPAVPPAPIPVKLPGVTLDPPLIRGLVRAPRNQAPGDDSPTMAIPVPPPAVAVGTARATPTPSRHTPSMTAQAAPAPSVPDSSVPEPSVPASSGLLAPEGGWLGLRPAGRREPTDDLIWQSRFAQVAGGVIGGALLLLTLPLWVVLFGLTGKAADNGGGPEVRSLVGLSMLLLGVLLSGAATWMIIVEMRGRARMVDALARGRDTGFGPASFEPAHLDPARFDPARFDPARFDPAHFDLTQLGPGPDEANQPVTAPLPIRFATVAPSGGALRTFGQLPAQVAILAVAAALFLGATILTL